MKALYEIYSGNDLLIAEKIQRRRLQILVHSYIYYELDDNLISDSVWSSWAIELSDLQNKYPSISRQVIYADSFSDWDGSTGAFLPYKNSRIVSIANRLLDNRCRNFSKNIKQQKIIKKLF